MNWTTVEFESIYSIPSRNGLNRPSGIRGKGYKFINMGELFGHDRIGSIEMERVEMNDKELATMLIEEGDLLFARQSLVLSGAGKCSIVKEVDEPTTFESHLIRVRLKRELANPYFYHYYFKSPKCPIRSIVTQGVQAGIRGNDLKQLKIHLPPIEIQNRIADIISAYDDLIENNRRRIQLLERSLHLLYKEWFVHLGFPIHEHSKIVDGIPEGWGKLSLSRFCNEIKVSVNPKEISSDTPYIGLEHIPRRSVTLSDWGTAAEVDSQKFAFKAGDILFGKIRPYFHKVGFTLTDGIASSDAVVIRPTESKFYCYCLLLVSSDEFISLASKTMREGSKMPRADWKYLSTCEFLIPPSELLYSFNEVCFKVINQLQNLALQNRKLQQARDLLLPKLMSGAIGV